MAPPRFAPSATILPRGEWRRAAVAQEGLTARCCGRIAISVDNADPEPAESMYWGSPEYGG